MCTNCGRLFRYAEPDELGDDHTTPPEDLSHGGGAFEASSEQPEASGAIETPSPEEGLASSEPQTSSDHPQIINHHASSHYRRRLNERMHALERPELEPPDDLQVSPGLTQQDHIDSANEHHLQETTTLATAATAADVWSQSDNHDTEVQHTDPLQTSHDTPETESEELWGPHKPSPHILDVASSTPDTHEQDLIPGSPLDLREADTDHPPVKDSTFHSTTPSTPIHTQSRGNQTKDSEALAKADALLAAASTQAPNKNSSNLVWLGITAVIVVGLASFLTFNLLKPANTQPTTSTSPSSTVSATQSPTNTQSASAKRDAQRKADLNDIAVGLSAYQKSTGKYPVGTDISALQPLTTANPPFIKSINSDPNNDPDNGVIIKYSYTSDGTTYTLAASLENKNDPDAKNGLYIVKSSSN